VRYDFLRGNEPYKYSFAGQEDRICCFILSTKNGRNLGDRLNPLTVGDALSLVTGLHQSGKLAEADRGYQQILQIDPDNADALYRYGQLLLTQARPGEAKRILARLIKARPGASKAWGLFAQACAALGQDVSKEARAALAAARGDLRAHRETETSASAAHPSSA
jgi:tetratricopeptide (TPR) repeat protein